ncbi:MAG: gliding motility-associated C-terminal domain-containing protein [Bacteroidales bacterium]|nr:gliding motility-associated C-terminal domain-containing protein [Bacteroidales bacterium]
MNNIKDILTHQKATPSPDCWDKISSRLDIVMPQGAEQAASQAASATTQGGHLLGSLAAKIAAGVVGVAAVATVATVALTRDKSAQPQESQPVVLVDTVDAETMDDQSQPVSPEVLQYTEYTSGESVSVNNSVSNNNNQNKDEVQPVQPVVNTQVTESIPVVAPVKVTAPVVESRVGKGSNGVQTAQVRPQPAVQSPHVAQTVQQDPVVQQLPEDAVDWTPPIKLEIPNVFTPNGDGVNDKFVIVGLENCMQRKLEVRNRAGQVVYRSNSYENTWDGGDCPDGMYRYMFLYTGDNGIEQTLSGVVTIIRR